MKLLPNNMRYGRDTEHVGGTGRAEVNSTYRQGGPRRQMESSFSKTCMVQNFSVSTLHTQCHNFLSSRILKIFEDFVLVEGFHIERRLSPLVEN